MKFISIIFSLFIITIAPTYAQPSDKTDFAIELEPIHIKDLPGLQSYAVGQYEGKWLIIGGRTEGIHARQGHSSFPGSRNNTTVFVIDVREKRFWSASVDSLPTNLSEQLQSTNMIFYQDKETLFLVGGYALSKSKNRHITYPYLTSVNLPKTIEAVMNGSSVLEGIIQLEDERFALTGGQMSKLGDTYVIAGGHRFDGRYNPHGPDHGMGFKQSYSNGIHQFKVEVSSGDIVVSDFKTMRDLIHLRRRDFNLIPNISADGRESLTITSGVFQMDKDLPYHHPIEFDLDGYKPITQFNQLLSNYHSAKVSLYDAKRGNMHHVFLGGISRFYLEGNDLKKDDQVPFVNTISQLSRDQGGIWRESALSTSMPGYLGAGAEFIVHPDHQKTAHQAILLPEDSSGRMLLGHMYGGIASPMQHAFFNYETSSTYADSTIYAVYLNTNSGKSSTPVSGVNPYSIKQASFNSTQVALSFDLAEPVALRYYMTNADGFIVLKGSLSDLTAGANTKTIAVESGTNTPVSITLVFDDQWFVSSSLK
jgi:hypothetical protein